ncbi:hypothetical protein MMC13_001004 [Lambiella insularis]|nr:hypothetical protein [Lambiella insularis]
MARTLPWLKDGPKATAKVSHLQIAKRQRVAESTSEDDALPLTTGVSTPRRKLSARPDRTPSTSPPPQPPSEEFMLEGLSRDDIHIMVEDEFHAVAKQFTQHLHHAEYKRLRDLAKTRNESAITTISRPTDSITAMREETKKRKENEAKAAKQKVALEQIKSLTAAKRPKTGSDEESDVEVTRDDDPWVGTTLQGLMTSPSKNHTSLTGLQAVLSSTRAAAGYSKPERPVGYTKPFDLVQQSTSRTPGQRVVEALELDGEATATEEDDDLDAPAANKKPTRNIAIGKTTVPVAKPRPQSSTTKTHSYALPSLPSPPAREKIIRPLHNRAEAKSILKRKKVTSNLDIFDDLPAPPPPQSEVSKRIMKRRAEMNARKGSKGMETTGLGSVNEIPIFLV